MASSENKYKYISEHGGFCKFQAGTAIYEYDAQPKHKDLGFKTFFGNWTRAYYSIILCSDKKHELKKV